MLGSALILLAASAGVSYNNYLPIESVWARLALGVIGLAMVLVSTVLVRVSPRSAKPYGVSILTPTAGDEVDLTTVQGTIRKAIPSSYQLWVLRFYPDGAFVPLHQAVIDMENQKWVAYQCTAGGSKGDIRFFVAALVGPDGQALIDYFFQAADRHNGIMDRLDPKRTEPFRFLPTIAKKTKDVVECDRVRVKRA